MNDQIALSLNLANGETLRFGGDEKDAANVPSAITWDTSIPGGFGAASITLPRPPSLYADDARLFSDLVIYGAGAKVLYEGYVTAIPQVGAQEIQLQTSGWSTTLERVQTFKEIFVDRDLGRWRGQSTARQTALRTASNNPGGPDVVWDVSSPALVLKAEEGTANPMIEAYYDAGPGPLVSRIYYNMTSVSTSGYVGIVGVSSDDVRTSTNATADLLTGTNSSDADDFTPATKRRYGFISFSLGGTVGATGTEMKIKDLAVYGDHGLTLRGSEPKGVYASDVVDYVIEQSALNTNAASIEATTFAIPHLIYPEDTSLRQVIEEVSALGGEDNVPNDWGTYENKTFFWRSPGTYGRTWRVRRDQVATAESEGPEGALRTAGIKVTYTDPAGISKSVGPVGSNADFETNDLLDIDPDNPAFRIDGAYARESVGITTQQGAINIGKLILNERNRLRWRGSITLQGEATDENGNQYPVAEVRAGDQIIVEDDTDLEPRPINSTSYNHQSLTLSANVGARSDSLESLLGQLAAVTDIFGA